MDEFINREIAEFTQRYKLPAKIPIPASIPEPEFSIPQPTPAQDVAHAQPMPRVQISKWKLPVIQLTCGQPSDDSGSAEELPDEPSTDYSSETETETESDYSSETETESEDDYKPSVLNSCCDWLDKCARKTHRHQKAL